MNSLLMKRVVGTVLLGEAYFEMKVGVGYSTLDLAAFGAGESDGSHCYVDLLFVYACLGKAMHPTLTISITELTSDDSVRRNHSEK